MNKYGKYVACMVISILAFHTRAPGSSESAYVVKSYVGQVSIQRGAAVISPERGTKMREG